MTFIMPQAAAAVTLPYRRPHSLALRAGQGAREGDMSQRLPNGLAWTLLGLTVALQTAAVVLGLTGGETWTAALGFAPVTLSFALVGALIAVRAGPRHRPRRTARRGEQRRPARAPVGMDGGAKTRRRRALR
jgi:hypothetical protein